MSISAVGSSSQQVQPQQVSPSALKSADNDGDGRSGVAALNDGDTLSFTRLQDILDLTPGNLITHLRKLEDAGYIHTAKTGAGTTSQTSVTLTHHGRAALESYTQALRKLLTGL